MDKELIIFNMFQHVHNILQYLLLLYMGTSVDFHFGKCSSHSHYSILHVIKKVLQFFLKIFLLINVSGLITVHRYLDVSEGKTHHWFIDS
jgi:hypothetical protein